MFVFGTPTGSDLLQFQEDLWHESLGYHAALFAWW